MKEAFQSSKSIPTFGRPMPLVLSRGSVMPRGFQQRLKAVVERGGLPAWRLSEIRLAKSRVLRRGRPDRGFERRVVPAVFPYDLLFTERLRSL